MKIIIADDHAVVRSGFMHLINFQEDMKVIATAADGREAYTLVAKYKPDILLLDLSMPPGESGLITTGRIKEDIPETKIIILTMYAEEEYLFNVLKSGASGYVLKKAPDEELIKAIRTVYEGGTYIDPTMATSLVREFVHHNIASETDPFQTLSKRELEVLPLAAKGYGNKEIAEMLFISVKTVEAHKSKIMEKLHLKNRPELVEYALKKKLLNF
ncbi:LuxR family two component transcriptional regulator [Pseudogracilibacillus auburnensis]|uniref:LuxR family two component transcriptional regulator n=2 Tax=Pseudogracilibacillus auburnensis TaxID=1494959 RepID=A0A2V3VUQ0_9BACI|nr:response regulator transcription factor [Pseudogracilibacillus auburnensis]PXW85637.1 LuxR family two component transcriptional regulator [Pseudogracilibacillus auburnensis]